MGSSLADSLGLEFRAGDWVVQPGAGSITRGGQELHLRPMLMKLLVLLAEHAGHVLTKDQILDRVWEAEFVGESALTRDVAELRRLLGDSRSRPRYIETIPKRGYRFVATVQRSRRAAEPRLAVLVFENRNRDPELDYFAEGVTDALITELGNIGSLRVISRQSVLHYRNTDRSLPEIARELKVQAVIEGAVLQAGDHVRITAQLIQAEPEQHLWARHYDCDVRDVLAVQAKVARAVAESVQATLTPQNLVRLSRPLRVNPETHLAYLKARHHAMKWTEDGVQKGLQYLREAIAKDPEYAPAHELLASCLAIIGFAGHMPIRLVYPQAKEAALKAVELDESLSDGHAALGLVIWLLDWDPAACERELLRAIELNPSSANARQSYALYLVTIPRDRTRALDEAKLSLDLDPLSLDTNFGMAWILFFAGEFERAMDHALKTLELFPDSHQTYNVLGWAYLGRSMNAEAVGAFEKVVGLSRDPVSLGYLGYACGLAGRREAAQAVLDELLRNFPPEVLPGTSLAYLYAGLDDFDRAIAALERCYEQRDSRLFWFPLAIFSPGLSSDPRYTNMLRRLPAGISGQPTP